MLDNGKQYVYKAEVKKKIMNKLMLEKLQEYVGHTISVLVEGGEVFTGKLKLFDDDILVFEDIIDSRGNKGIELMVTANNVLWMILED